MRNSLTKLKRLSDNNICSIPYPPVQYDNWVRGDISFLIDSGAPSFIKDILKHKKREGSSRHQSSWYFGEGYLSTIFGDQVTEGWFSSFKWLSDPEWVSGRNSDKESDPVIAELKSRFYQDAIKKYIGLDMLAEMQIIGAVIEAKAPDLWFIDKTKRHYFIEVKKEKDSPDMKQLLGLALLEKCLKVPTYIVYLYPENKGPLSIEKQDKWLRDYNSAKAIIDAVTA